MPIYSEYKKENNILLIILFFLIYITFNIKSIKSEISDCPKAQPIYKSNECKLEYCTKEQFESEQCIIKNEIVKTQWLNNIIIIGDTNFRYLNYASYKNGDMVIQSTKYPVTKARKFYGIKNNGRPFFTKDSKETPYYTKVIEDTSNGMLEGQCQIVKDSVNDEEYFFCVSKNDCNAEMFDLKNDNVYWKTTRTFTENKDLITLHHALIPITSTTAGEYHYLFSFILQLKIMI